MNMLIFGSRGYMGGHFLSLYPDAIRPEVDIADPRAVATALEKYKPDVVINCSGKTGKPNVDWCEDHREETLRSNVTGPLVLLSECAKRKIYWVHLSTGCIYEGDNGWKGFSEEDPPNFFGSFYSRTKAWSDQILREFPLLNLRLRMPFSGEPHDRNLITKLARYSKVLDVQNSLTSVPDFLKAAKTLIEKRSIGTYNIVNPRTISPYHIMELYKEVVNPSHVFERLSLQELPSEVRAGRSNCILSTEKLANEGIVLQPIEEAVEKALREYQKAMAGSPLKSGQ